MKSLSENPIILPTVMKSFLQTCSAFKQLVYCGSIRLAASATLLYFAFSLSAAESIKTFATPEEATSALISAINSKNSDALHALFGPAGTNLENPDRVQSTNELATFAEAYNQAHRLTLLNETRYVLEVGADYWPFPIPIVKKENRWFFDTDVGKDELLSRRIGENELATLEIMRTYADAQREYASKDRDGDEVLEYAQRLASSPGKTDGLYWPTELNGEASPLGPLVADAQTEGYFKTPALADGPPTPFHGYLFKILIRQSAHAPGGKFDYIINGNMILGFALVAWPAEYASSGVMTFIVNQQGRVYQKNLGAKTSSIVKQMRAYDPDPSWQISHD